MFTIQGCSPKRGEICSCTHVPEIRYTHIKTVSHSRFLFTMLLTAPTLPFKSLISLNFSSKFKFFRFADMLTKTDYICAHNHCNLQTDSNLGISLKH